MVFMSNTYSVLLVSSSKKFVSAVMPLLPESEFWPVTTAGSANEARRSMVGVSFDIVIVNAPLPDDAGVDLALEAGENDESCVLLLIGNEIYEETYYKLLPYGILTLSKPTSMSMVTQNLRVLCAMREKLRRLRQKQSTVEEKMGEIRLINRAKWVLINERRMSEPDAHRYILQQAMDRRLSKRAVAEEILREAKGGEKG